MQKKARERMERALEHARGANVRYQEASQKAKDDTKPNPLKIENRNFLDNVFIRNRGVSAALQKNETPTLQHLFPGTKAPDPPQYSKLDNKPQPVQTTAQYTIPPTTNLTVPVPPAINLAAPTINFTMPIPPAINLAAPTINLATPSHIQAHKFKIS